MIVCETWAQTCPGPPPRSSSPRCPLALVANSSHSSLLVFRHLRTLSFLGSQLSRVLPASCALFRKKNGGTPLRGPTTLLLSLLFPLHTNTSPVCLLFPLLTQKRGSIPPPKNVGAPTFLIFPLIFRTFVLLPCNVAFRLSSASSLATGRGSLATFPRLFLSPPKFAPKLPPISQYTSLTGLPFS